MLTIGTQSFDSQVVLAPMAGVCDLPFRAMVRRFDQKSLIWGEMISSVGLFHWGRHNLEYLAIAPEEPPVALQIFGHDPLMMKNAARRVCETASAIVDINCGCPAPKIVKGGDGAALMKNPELFARVLAAVVEASSKPVTVKFRLGWDESSMNYLEFARIAEGCGASAITVHGRTRSQHYAGTADWSKIRQVVDAVSIPVIGNGDIADPVQAKRLLEESGCAAVMVGRGAMGAPWLIGRIQHFLATEELLPEPSWIERLEIAREHARLLIQEKTERVAVPEMRKHFGWYTRGMPGSAELRGKINETRTEEALYQVLDAYTETLLAHA